jgi:transcriptional regulator with XRE-family HTH domain
MNGEALKSMRTELNLSRAKVCKVVDISDETLYQLETNIQTNPTANTIISLAEFYDCSSDYLLGLSDSPKRA